MRHLMEICLTLGEWIEDRRGKASGRSVIKDSDKKTILTFLSQGAVGGAVGYFLLTAGAAVLNPSGYNVVVLVTLPLILAFGGATGAATAIFVWLPEVLLKRRARFIARAIIIFGGMALLGAAFSYWSETPQTNELPILWLIGALCAIEVPVVLMTGSRIRALHLIVFGASERPARHSLLPVSLGLLLRAASVFGLLEALMTLALWISARRVDWLGFPAPEHLPVIVFAILYFATSAYLSFKSPRKIVLLSTAIVLNLPMAAWVGSLRRAATEESTGLAYVLLGFMCLWTVYTLICLLAPESVPAVVNLARGTAAVRNGPQRGNYSVQL